MPAGLHSIRLDYLCGMQLFRIFLFKALGSCLYAHPYFVVLYFCVGFKNNLCVSDVCKLLNIRQEPRAINMNKFVILEIW